MNVEILIYAYLAICTSMIAFNCVCIYAFRKEDMRLMRSSLKLEEDVVSQLCRVRLSLPVEQEHRMLLRKRLRRVGDLAAFDASLGRLLSTDHDTVWDYILNIRPVFAYLAVDNRYKDAHELSFFAYVVSKYRILAGGPIPALLELMMSLLDEPSIYCRENALSAIYSTEDCQSVVLALKRIDSGVRFPHANMLTDGLLTFRGDTQQLCRALWRELGSFSAPMRLVVLDYIRLAGADMRREMAGLLADGSEEDELRFSCIRYFAKYPYQPVFPLLIEFAGRGRVRRWEYAALSAEALAAYPGERTVEVLKRALGSVNWFVRDSAARSLESFNLDYRELFDVIGDRYAREILEYRIDLKAAAWGREEAI